MTWFVCLFAVAGSAAAIDVPPASLHVSAPIKDGVAHYDLKHPFTVTLLVEGKTGLEVKPPRPVTRSQAWTLLSEQPAQVLATGAGRVRWQQTFVFDPLLRPGRHELLIGSLSFREPPGDWQTIDWPDLPIEVAASEENSKPADVRDITGIQELPEATSFWRQGLWAVLAISGGAALWIFAGRWRRRRGAGARLNAAERAQHELDRIRALTVSGARFHGMLANVLRTYLDNRFGLHARRRTTEELRMELDGVQLSSASRQELLNFLHDCDLAKFAGNQSSKDECERRLRWVTDFVRQSAAPVTPPSPPA